MPAADQALKGSLKHSHRNEDPVLETVVCLSMPLALFVRGGAGNGRLTFVHQ